MSSTNWLLENNDNFLYGHNEGFYSNLRQLDRYPVVKTSSTLGLEQLLVHGYDDVRFVSQRPEVFTSVNGAFQHPKIMRIWKGRFKSITRKNMNSTDGSEHACYRRLLSPHLAAGVLQSKRECFDRHATRTLEKAFVGGKEFDAVSLAFELSAWVLQRIFGIKQQYHSVMIRWGTELLTDSSYSLSSGRSILAMTSGISKLARSVLDDPVQLSDSLMSVVSKAELTELISREEAEAYFFLFLLAGVQATAQTMVHAFIGLSRYPKQLSVLRDMGLRNENGVDELIRWTSASKQLYRSAICDTQIGSQTIRKGTVIALLFGAANRDPRVFAEGDTLMLDRQNARRHLSFGAGTHFCIGANLARMQLSVLMYRLGQLATKITQKGALLWHPSRHLTNIREARFSVLPA